MRDLLAAKASPPGAVDQAAEVVAKLVRADGRFARAPAERPVAGPCNLCRQRSGRVRNLTQILSSSLTAAPSGRRLALWGCPLFTLGRRPVVSDQPRQLVPALATRS